VTYPDTLVFLGAGASAPFKVPVMKDMVSQLSTPGVIPAHLKNDLDQLGERLRDMYRDDYDLEKLLDVVHDLSEGKSIRDSLRALAPHALYRLGDVISRSRGDGELAVQSSDAGIVGGGGRFGDLERAVVAQIADWCAGANFPAAETAYRGFLGELSDPGVLRDGRNQPVPGTRLPTRYGEDIRRVLFATTNYDETLDSALAKMEVPTETGFHFNETTQVSGFELSAKFGDQNKVGLLKLHGSVSWWRTSHGDVVYVPQGRQGDRLLNGAKLERREIRYPVATKNLGGLPYSTLYTRLSEALAEARVWIVIGYAFGDASIVQLFEELWTPEKRLVVVGPHPDAVAERQLSKRLREGCVLVPCLFGESDAVQAIKSEMISWAT
jgi:hypothetical protein